MHSVPVQCFFILCPLSYLPCLLLILWQNCMSESDTSLSKTSWIFCAMVSYKYCCFLRHWAETSMTNWISLSADVHHPVQLTHLHSCHVERAWVNGYSLLICARGSWMWISCGAHSLLICATGVQMWISSGASPMNTEPDQSFKLILNLPVQVQRESLWENNWLPALFYLQSWRGPVLCIFQEHYKQRLL